MGQTCLTLALTSNLSPSLSVEDVDIVDHDIFEINHDDER